MAVNAVAKNRYVAARAIEKALPYRVRLRYICCAWLAYSPNRIYYLAKVLEHFGKVAGNSFGIVAFYLVALNKVYQFTVFKQCHSRR